MAPSFSSFFSLFLSFSVQHLAAINHRRSLTKASEKVRKKGEGRRKEGEILGGGDEEEKRRWRDDLRILGVREMYWGRKIE